LRGISEMLVNNKKLLVVIFSVLIVALIVIAIYEAIPKTKVLITVAPGEVQLSIDNKQDITVSDNQTLSITPGTHTFKVSESQFASYSTSLTFKKGQTTELLVALTAETTEAQTKLDNSDVSQAVIQRFQGNIEQAQTNALNKKYPIIADLPIETDLYSINVCPSQKYPNDPTKIALCIIETDPSVGQYALNAITNKGFSPNNYEIIYMPKSSSAPVSGV
jgi:hypothetical protein